MLLVLPAIPIALLFGIEDASREASLIARVLGAALFGIGLACWLGRSASLEPSQRGLIAGTLVYDVAATALLAYAGSFLNLAGIALWPAVVLHALLAVWCAVCLWK